jgi:hypothetical protein
MNGGEIVGVVGEVRNRGAAQPVGGIVYLPVLLNDRISPYGRSHTSFAASALARAAF